MEYGKVVYWVLQVAEVCLWYCLLFPEMTDRQTRRGERGMLWTAVLIWGGMYGYRGLIAPIEMGYAEWGFLRAAFCFALFYPCRLLEGSLWAFVSCNTVYMVRMAVLLGVGIATGERMREVLQEDFLWLNCLTEFCLSILLFLGLKQRKKHRIHIMAFLRKSWPFFLAAGCLELVFLEYILNMQKWNDRISHTVLVLSLCAAAITVCGLTAVTFWYLNGLRKEEDRQTQLRLRVMGEQYASWKEEYEKFARLIHERNRERQYLRHCLRTEQYAKALAYLEKDESKQKRQVWTGNAFWDYLIYSRKQRLDEEAIAFSFDAEFTDSPIPEEDFWILLGNLLDNAEEAAVLCEPGRRWIHLEFRSVNTMFLVRLKNSSSRVPIVKNGRFCSTKAEGGHGFGTENIRRIVNQYGGILRQTYTETEFCAEIFLEKENGLEA